MSKQFETTHWDADKVRSQGEKSAQNRRRKNKKFNWGIYIACVVLGSVVLASLGWLLANDLCSLNKKDVTVRSEERRVGKEGRSRWAAYHLKKKK